MILQSTQRQNKLHGTLLGIDASIINQKAISNLCAHNCGLRLIDISRWEYQRLCRSFGFRNEYFLIGKCVFDVQGFHAVWIRKGSSVYSRWKSARGIELESGALIVTTLLWKAKVVEEAVEGIGVDEVRKLESNDGQTSFLNVRDQLVDHMRVFGFSDAFISDQYRSRSIEVQESDGTSCGLCPLQLSTLRDLVDQG